MKKIILTLAVVAIAFGANAQKRGEAGFKNVVKVNPLGLLFGLANVSYEYVLSEKSSVQGNIQFGGRSSGNIKTTFAGAGVDYKFYLSHTKTAPKGFYASPGVGFYALTVKDGTSKYTGSGLLIKGVVGNQWVWESGFSLDLFGGINYLAGNKVSGTGGVTYDTFSGTLPALGVSLGYAF